MSDTRVYGFCEAGCKREVVPKDGNAASATVAANAEKIKIGSSFYSLVVSTDTSNTGSAGCITFIVEE